MKNEASTVTVGGCSCPNTPCPVHGGNKEKIMSESLRDKFTRNAEEFDALMVEMLEDNERLTAERDALRKCEHALSDAYLRIRTLLNAFDTPTAPTAEEVWVHTEDKLQEILNERDELAASNARLLEVIRMINHHYDSPVLRKCLEETTAQAVAHIQAQGMQMAADICEGLYMGTYEGCNEHHCTDNCAKAIEAAKKELKGE